MANVDPSVLYLPLPRAIANDPETLRWGESLIRLLNELWIRTGGDLDFIATANDDVDTLQGDVTSLEGQVTPLVNGSPTYAPSNDATDRTWDANAAVAGTGIDVADAGPANVALLSDHDALVGVVQELSDVVATVVTDLQSKGVFG